MIKYLLTTITTLLFSVGFMYYLIQQTDFIPIDQNGGYIWINLLVLVFLLTIAAICLFSLVIFGIRSVLWKECGVDAHIKKSLKYGVWLTIALILVYVLHFFHILNFWWGVGILAIVILALFVI